MAGSDPPATGNSLSPSQTILKTCNILLRTSLRSDPSPTTLPTVLSSPLSTCLRILAARSLERLGTLPPTHSDLIPLEYLSRLVETIHTVNDIPITWILDLIIAYPNHPTTVQSILQTYLENNTIILNSFRKEVIEVSVRLLEKENRTILAPIFQKQLGQGIIPDEIADAITGTNNPPSSCILIPQLAYSLYLYSRANPLFASTILNSRNCLSILQLAYKAITSLPSTILSPSQRIQTKSHLLLLLHELLEGMKPLEREMKLGMLEDIGDLYVRDQKIVLSTAGMGIDYRVIFGAELAENQPAQEKGQPAMIRTVGENEMTLLRDLSNGLKVNGGEVGRLVMVQTVDDSRIAPILSLFPTIPANLLHSALRHPRFNPIPPSGTPADNTTSPAEPDSVTLLTNALLDNNLPPDLTELQAALREGLAQIRSSMNTPSTSEGERDERGGGREGGKKRYKRENIWNDVPLDFSNFKRGKDTSGLDSITSNVPEHIRASIMRLTEQQRDEEEAARELEREEARARRARATTSGAGAGSGNASSSSFAERLRGQGLGGAAGVGASKIRTVAFEEELEEDELFDEEIEEGGRTRSLRLGLREGEEGSSDGEGTVNGDYEDGIGSASKEEEYLEKLYLQNASAFGRDAATRRSKVREQMRKETGWTDEQLEGWKIMLDRNPLKERILGRHAGPGTNRPAPELERNNHHRHPFNQNQQQHGPPRGGGGGRGGSNGRGGGGGGGGRGRGGSKNSRGHSNAARTRGHDKKMQRMGAV